jgi:uncharacterized protein (DUF2249 family)
MTRPDIRPARLSSMRVRRHGGTHRPRLRDDDSVVLWQTCAYAAAVVDTAQAGHPVETRRRDLVRFLREGPLAEYAGIRSGIEAIEASRGSVGTRLAVEALVADLERRMRHGRTGTAEPVDAAERWALPLLLSDDIDLASLPSAGRERLLLTRLQRMRRADVVRLHADHDLHPLWRALHTRTRGDHGWVYEQAGPVEWTARVTRRGCG